MLSKPIIIGISGASASGKSLLATTIVKELGTKEVVVIPEDSYYKDRTDLTLPEREKINYDHPSSLDHELLYQHLKQLHAGETVHIPIYNYKHHQRELKTRKVEPRSIIILEGILLFVSRELRDLMNIKIFMDTPLDICLIRRLHRDIEERGRTLNSVLGQYEETVRPMFLKFIEPSKVHADLIVPRGGENRIAIDMIQAKMRELLKASKKMRRAKADAQ